MWFFQLLKVHLGAAASRVGDTPPLRDLQTNQLLETAAKLQMNKFARGTESSCSRNHSMPVSGRMPVARWVRTVDLYLNGSGVPGALRQAA